MKNGPKEINQTVNIKYDLPERLSDIRLWIDEKINQYGGDALLTFEGYSTEISYKRMETEAEFKERHKQEQLREAYAKERRRKEFEQLKKEFEK